MKNLSFTRSLLIILVLTGSYSSYSQPSIEWQYMLGGSSYDYAYDIIQTSDGGYLTVGAAQSNDGDVSGHYGGTDTADFWVVRLDPGGAIQWEKYFGGTGWDIASAGFQLKDGGYFVAGYSGSVNGNVTGNHGSLDGWVIRLDSYGNLLWERSYGGSSPDLFHEATLCQDRGFVLAGVTGSNDGDVSGNHGNSDYWVVKIDSSGNLLWQKCLGGSSSETCTSVIETEDDGFILNGSTQSNDGDVGGLVQGGYDYWMVRLNSAGDLQWQKCLGGSQYDFGREIRQIADGGFIATGFSKSNDSFVSGNHGGDDYWVVRTDSSGNLLWQKSLGGTSNDLGTSVAVTNNGNFLLAGYSRSNDGDVSGNHGDFDYWILQLDSSGDLQWQKCYGGSDKEITNSIIVTSDGTGITSGYSASTDGDVTGHKGQFDFWVVKLSSGIVGDEQTSLQNTQEIFVHANPADENIYWRIAGDPLPAELIIYDVAGRTVSKTVLTKEQGSFPLHLPDGIYCYWITGKKHSFYSGKMAYIRN